ncbi:unnamed protein product, partial [Heterosigma akashiwo]
GGVVVGSCELGLRDYELNGVVKEYTRDASGQHKAPCSAISWGISITVKKNMAKRNSFPLFPTEQDGESVQCILCGESVAPAFIQAHEKVACSRRTVRCLRCKDSIYLNEFSLHESLCAGSLYKLPILHKDIGTEIIQVSTEEETKSSRASQNECTVQISSARQSPYDEEDTTKPASSESPQERPSSRPDGAAAAVPSPREESPPPPI